VKNKKIMIICGSVLLIGIIIGSMIFFVNKKDGDSTNSNNSIVFVGKAIKEIQNIQEKLQTENLNKENKITLENELSCYAYEKEDAKSIVNNFNNMFSSSLSNMGGIFYSYDKDEKNPQLYVCLKDGSNFTIIKNYKILEEDNESIKIGINTLDKKYSVYYYQKKDNNWHFDRPMISNNEE